MIKLSEFKEYGLEITWKLINIGMKNEVFKGELSTKDIIDYAVEKVVGGEESLNVLLLASEPEQNRDQIFEYVNQLARLEKADYDVEFRKWRVLYVIKYLPKSDEDFFRGLLDLGDIWALFDFPSDSPHVYAGGGNLTHEQYYSEENYNSLIRKHKEWVGQEIEKLRV